ncbi:hypothetical protein AFLA_003561 [Aspergillus flavus NRRL3357]|nr:hypothetical protein AFLA_003561 [Aspergillus flavus NRRL3357]
MCIWQSSASDPATHLNGWRDVRNLRQRLDAFFFRCGRSGSHEDPRGEADFDPCGLVSAEFKSTFRPSKPPHHRRPGFRLCTHRSPWVSELLFSFWDLDGLLPGSAEPLGTLRKYMLEIRTVEEGTT